VRRSVPIYDVRPRGVILSEAKNLLPARTPWSAHGSGGSVAL